MIWTKRALTQYLDRSRIGEARRSKHGMDRVGVQVRAGADIVQQREDSCAEPVMPTDDADFPGAEFDPDLLGNL